MVAAAVPGSAPADPGLQRLAKLAARLLSAPASQVWLLPDGRAAGAPADPAPPGSTDPLCAVTAAGRAPLVVDDAAADPRVASLPPVTGGAVRAYLGVPLLGQDGHVVGVLCVSAPAPRRWADADVAVLTDLAEAAAAELELSALSLQYEADRLRWQLAVAAGGVGSFDWDLRADVLTWDERVLELFGYTAEDFDGTMAAFEARVHPDDLERVRRSLGAAVGDAAPFEAEYRLVLPDGDTRWVKARGETVRGADGQPAHLLGAVHDTTAERHEDARVSRVLESMSSAFFSLDRDWRFSYVNAEAERVLQRPRAELLGQDVWELFPDAVGAEFERQYRRAMDTGEQVDFEAHYPAPLDRWYEVRAWRDPDGLSVYFLDVTTRKAAQQQAEAERAATQEALRTAERAQREARAAQEAAERTARRLALLARVSADLTATLDTEEAVSRLGRHLVPALGDWCIVTLVDGEGDLRDIGCWHAQEELRPLLERYREVRLPCLSPDAPLHQALREDRSVVLSTRAAERIGALLTEPARDLLRQLAPESVQMVPLRARGRTVGLVSVFRGAGVPAPSEEDLLIAAEVADRAGLALDNARLYAQQQHVAEGLQRSLLSAPVEPDHLQIVVRYRPAARSAQVGGDWYDAFLQADGATVLAIGDVMGHDITAAAAMSQVRSLLRGIAYFSGGTPAVVLSGLDAAMEGLAVDTTATAVVARLEQSLDERARGVTRLRWSNAGHPAPVLLTPDGTVTALTGLGHDLLLGIDPRAPRIDEQVALDRGSTLLLYTDGLVERRGQDYDEGLLRLHGAMTELAGADLDGLCDGVLARLLPEHAEDDVALVAVRLHPQDRPRPAEAGPRRVPPGVPAEPPPPGA
ncbi:SpoIIE family protein phosphatase [Kineococcus radiotolerans]|uniref:PAS/PAC sensor protein n=1 Tax=Kineococcus radiotolerans (strain ATCC BAA-149 / DSM 14245 / SRS30216) TaxID=266940 RepID=A6W450_KINRD|nr:SpoIIE family protein phosphatase [Kineococcus radiotolerans]ABS01589.1 putative PAS/PAC sensor protein [Kineococcus radiotolerans SRS30216 = ATCC BAA-149]